MVVKRSTVHQVRPLADTDPLVALMSANEQLRHYIEGLADDQERWQEERGWLRAMIDQVPDYLFVKDTNCRFIVANKAVAADLGESDPAMLIGRTDLDLHAADIAKRFFEADRKVMATGVPMLDIEEFVIRTDGMVRWLSTSKLPLRARDGEIIGLIGIARDITERKAAEDRIHYLAYNDSLTGLPNRVLFEVELGKAVEAARNGTRMALLLIDLDRFKHVNDTLGHVAGDNLLRQVASRLSQLVGPSGIVSRLGGDEFAVLLAGPAAGAAEALCGSILLQLNRPFNLFGDPAFIGASVGIAPWREGVGPDELLREADIALYEAKGRGRGRWQVFAHAMATGLEERRLIEQDLRVALNSGDQLQVEYQPIFSGDTGRVVGAEALVRWQHPERGRMSPELFVSVAEERGLIEKLGERVFDDTCRLLQETDIPWVAVNVSPVELRSRRVYGRILDGLAARGIDPSRLQLEITEGVLLDNDDSTEAGLRRLRAAGIRLALDDFGTGYSSLNYLRRYNVDKIKVDRSFVSQLGTSRDAAVIVKTIIGLACSMDKTVTAEGVETEQQRAYLVANGCHELQGYLLSEPLLREAFSRLTARLS